MAAIISASISAAAIGTGLSLRFDQLAAGIDRLVAQRVADPGFVDVDPGGGQVAEQFADDILFARFLEIGADNVLGIGFGFGLGQAHQARRPFAEKAIAPRDNAELHFLVMGIFGLERALAIVESGHGASLRLSLSAR